MFFYPRAIVNRFNNKKYLLLQNVLVERRISIKYLRRKCKYILRKFIEYKNALKWQKYLKGIAEKESKYLLLKLGFNVLLNRKI